MFYVAVESKGMSAPSGSGYEKPERNAYFALAVGVLSVSKGRKVVQIVLQLRFPRSR